MASAFTKIPRTLQELQKFLDAHEGEYKNAYEHLRPGMGWAQEKNTEHFFNIMFEVYDFLYENINVKLDESSTSTDEEILEAIRSFLSWNQKHVDSFKLDWDVLQMTGHGFVHDVVFGAVMETQNKLNQVLEIAREEKQLNRKYKLLAEEKVKRFQIGIVTVTDDEHHAALSILTDPTVGKLKPDNGFIYHTGFIQNDGKKLETVLVQCAHQGGAASAVATTQLIREYDPEIIVMLGHAAGNKNRKNELKVGHIMVAKESVDYEQVSVIEKLHEGEPVILLKDRKKPVEATSSLCRLVMQFSKDVSMLNKIKKGYTQSALFEDLGVYEGAIISGNALVRSETWFDRVIQENPGTIGLDMETFGMYYAASFSKSENRPKFISLKSVSDFGSNISGFSSQISSHLVRVPYACYISASFFKAFALAHLPL